MDLRAIIFLGLLFASVLLTSEVSGGELPETEEIAETYGVGGLFDIPHGGGYGRRGYGGGYRGGGNRRRCGGYGCCGGGYMCRCCTSAAEAEAYPAAQAKAKPQN